MPHWSELGHHVGPPAVPNKRSLVLELTVSPDDCASWIRVSRLPSPAIAEHIMGAIRLAPTALPAMKPRRVSACRTASPIRLHIALSSRKVSCLELPEDTPGRWFAPSEELLFPYRHLVFRADACVRFDGEATATAGTANALSIRGLCA